MKKNPAQPKQETKNNAVLETLKSDVFKTTMANIDYSQVLTRTWRGKNTGTKRAS
jgi:hypothetical protein